MKKDDKLLLNSQVGGFVFTAMMFVYLFVNFIGQMVCSVLFEQGSVAYIAVCSCFATASLLTVSLCVAKKSNAGFNLFRLRKFDKKYIAFALLLACGMFFGLGFVNNLFVDLLKSLGFTISGTDFPLSSPALLILFCVLLAFLPSILEEIFFRGVMFSALEKSGTIFAIFTVSICFALYHCSFAQLIYQFIYGVGLALLAFCAKSAVPCIIAHFTNNFLVVILTYFKVEINFFHPALISLGLLMLAGFFFLSLINVKKLGVIKKQKSGAVSFWLPFGWFGCLICVLLLVGSLFVG